VMNQLMMVSKVGIQHCVLRRNVQISKSSNLIMIYISESQLVRLKSSWSPHAELVHHRVCEWNPHP
jgi:hypothetical protein